MKDSYNKIQCTVEYTDFSDRGEEADKKGSSHNYEGNTFGGFKVYDNICKDFNNVGCRKKTTK